ncbi:hypothetical protein EDD86DRAFT_212022 [Gorgonomyces haynaldii]|nr:hypothetical protein EDD86DRAFT_212022 [Gorgonomyces haynaldii]
MADFTEVYKQSNQLSQFSPSGEYIATAVQQRLIIRQTDTLQIHSLYTCLDNITGLQFSPSSEMVCCWSSRLKSWQIFHLFQEFHCQVDEGLAGLVKIIWSPDARHILSFSDFNLRITVWSLLTKEAHYIQFPKHSDRGYQFRSDNKYFAVLERNETDFVSIYETEDWTLVKRFPLQTQDVDNLEWSPDGRFICVWEPLTKFKVFVYYPDGRLVTCYEPYEHRLGIKSLKWSPSGQILAIGSFDESVHLLNHYTWQPLDHLKHPKTLSDRSIVLYKEQEDKQWNQNSKISYTVSNPPATLFQARVDPEKPNPKLGVGLLGFDCTGQLLCTRNDNQPTSLWIWDMTVLRVSVVLQQQSPIKTFAWNPIVPGRLAFCTSNGYIYLWDVQFGAEAIQVPQVNFQVLNLKWNPDGKSLMLLDKDKFCLAFLLDD